MRFDPAAIEVQAGQPVQLTFQNEGRIIHDWTLQQGVPSRVQALAAGGGSATVMFSIANPGTYRFVCAQPGHESAGMHGTIVAQ